MGTVRARLGGLGDFGEAEGRRRDAALARAAAAQRREATSADDLRAHTPPEPIAVVDPAAAATPAVAVTRDEVSVVTDPRVVPGHRLLRPVAATLSFVVPGLGQLAVGHLMRGLRWYLGAVVVWTATLMAATHALPKAMWMGIAVALGVHVAAAVDGARQARQPRPLGPTWLDTAAALFAGFLLAALPVAALAQTRARFVSTLPVQTPSMYPTLEVGDHLLVAKQKDGFARGDLIVFGYPRNPSTQYVKRVIGVGGDLVEVRGDEISVNGQPLARSSLDEVCRAEGPEGSAACSMWGETLEGRWYRVAERAPDKTNLRITVPAGHYFVVGDNRDGSNDSRLFGPVPESLVLGRASFIWWSAHPDGVRWRRINRALH